MAEPVLRQGYTSIATFSLLMETLPPDGSAEAATATLPRENRRKNWIFIAKNDEISPRFHIWNFQETGTLTIIFQD